VYKRQVRSRRQAITIQQAPPDEIRRVVETTPGGVITALGVVALALLLWLMLLKPF